MSAKTLTSLYGHPSGTILRDVSYDILTRLVQAGLATWDLTGGVEQVRPTINTRATFQEQQLFVPDNALDPDSGSSPVTAVVNPGGGIRLSAGGMDPLVSAGIDAAPAGCGVVLVDWDDVTIGTPTAGWTIAKDTSRRWAGRTTLKVTATSAAAATMTCTLTIPATYFGGAKRILYSIDPGDAAVTGEVGKDVSIWLNLSGGDTHRIRMQVNGSHAVGEFFDSGALFDQDINDSNPGSHMSGTPQWVKINAEEVTTLTLVMTKTAGTEIAIPAYIGPMVADPVRDERPIISIFMDGQYSGQWKYARQIFAARGIRSSLAVVQPWVSGPQPGTMTQDQLLRMYAAGHELICHTGGTGATLGYDNMTKYPDGQEYALIKADIEAFWAWLRSIGATRGIGYGVMPYTNGLTATQTYQRRLNISNALRDAGMLGVRQLAAYQGSFYGNGGERQTLVTKSIIMTSSTVAAGIVSHIDVLKARGGWSGISMHDIVMSGATGNNISVTTLETVADKLAAELKAGTVRVLPFSDAMRAIRAVASPA